MASELIVTSAPRGLQSGRSGFTTVLRTRGIHPDLAARLEAASGYRHVYPQGDSRNPVIYSYTKRQSALGEVWVISRIADAGNDYTGRSNKIAHHIALQEADIAAAAASSPAAVIMAMNAERILADYWSGEPREVATAPRIPAPPVGPAVCSRWLEASGDAGWAGYLAERALKNESTWVIAPPSVDLLSLFSEALALVPPAQRWRIPFTTYSLRGDEGRWLGVAAGTPEADAAAAQQRIPVIDLRKRSTTPSASAFVLAARGEGAVPWQRNAAAAPAASSVAPGAGVPPAGQRISGKRGVTLPPPILPSASAGGPLSAKGADGMFEEGLPPLPPLPASPVRRRLLLVAIGVVAGMAMLTGGALAAYWSNTLPAGWREGIGEWAWRHGLSKEPPTEVADAFDAKASLDSAFRQLDEVLGNEDETLGHHPSLLKRWRALKNAQRELAEVLGDEKTLRTLDFEKKLRPYVDDAAKALDGIDWAIDKDAEELVALHLKCAAALSHKAVDGENKSFKEAREKLVEALPEKRAPEDRDELERLLANLEKARQRSGVSSTDKAEAAAESQQEDDGPKAIDLIIKAVNADNHMPKTAIKAAGGESVKVIEWTEKASLASLAEIQFAFPKFTGDDESPVALKPIPSPSKDQPMKWECSAGTPRKPVGEFRLTEKAVTFKPNEANKDEAYPWLYLPLLICRKDDPGKCVTWVQLMTPEPAAPIEVGTGNPGKVPVVERLFSEALSEELKKIFKAKNVKWRPLKIRVADVGAVTIAPHGGQFSSGFDLEELPSQGWWRPLSLNTDTTGGDSYHEDFELNQTIDVSNGDVSAQITAHFKVDDFLAGDQDNGDPVSRGNAIQDVAQKARARDPILGNNWFPLVRNYAAYVLSVPDKTWSSMDPRERMAVIDRDYVPKGRKSGGKKTGEKNKDGQPEAVPSPFPAEPAGGQKADQRGPEPAHEEAKATVTGSEKKSFSEWLQHLQSAILSLPGSHRYIEEFVSHQDMFSGEETKDLGEKPQPPADDEDSKAHEEYEKKHAAWSDREKRSRATLEERKKKLLGDEAEFREWSKHVLASKDVQLETLVLVKLWRDLDRYRIVSSAGFIYESAKRKDGKKSLQEVARNARLLLTGDLVLEWSDVTQCTSREAIKTPPVVVLVRASDKGTGSPQSTKPAQPAQPPEPASSQPVERDTE